MTAISAIERVLQAYENMRQKLRDRAMVYQADLKDAVAAHYGLDPHALYDMPHEAWAVLRERYLREVGR